jgi:hypothetical protein
MNLSSLATLCEIDEDEVILGLSYWLHKGIISEMSYMDFDNTMADERYFKICEDQASLVANDMFSDKDDDVNSDMVKKFVLFFEFLTVNISDNEKICCCRCTTEGINYTN